VNQRNDVLSQYTEILQTSESRVIFENNGPIKLVLFFLTQRKLVKCILQVKRQNPAMNPVLPHEVLAVHSSPQQRSIRRRKLQL